MCAHIQADRTADSKIEQAIARARSLVIKVPDSDADLHAVAERTLQAIRKVSKLPHATDRYGLLRPHWEERWQCVDVHVSLGSVGRAVRILDGVLRACDELGVQLKSTKERGDHGQEYELLGERFQLCVREKVKQLPKATKTSEYRNKYDYEPKGILELQIITGGNRSCPARAWVDRPKEKLEDLLSEVVEAMVLVVDDARKAHAEARRREEERRNAERAAAEMKQIREDELASARTLLSQAEGWSAAEAVRRYAAAVRTKIEARGPIHVGSEAAEWLIWAVRTADRLDPMTSTQESRLELDELYPPPRQQQSWNGYMTQDVQRGRPSWLGGWWNRSR